MQINEEAWKKRWKKVKNTWKTALCVPETFLRANRVVGHSFAPSSREGLKMTAVLSADWHTDGDPVRDRNDKLRMALAGMSAAELIPDVLLIDGDITNSAHQCEYDNLNRMLKVYSKIPHVIPAMGNHDARGTDMEPIFEIACDLFRRFCEDCGYRIGEKNYYSTDLCGYRFIQLGTDSILKDDGYLSPEQLQWLDETLAQAAEAGRPVFIQCHQPFRGIHTEPTEFPGPSGLENPAKFVELLRKYADAGLTILYLFGHVHSDAAPDALTKVSDRLYTLELPALQYNQGGGVGYVLEAFEDRLRLRARNFISDTWLTDIDFTIPLK